MSDFDFSSGITDARRAFLGLEWREAKVEDAVVQTAHLLAAQTVEDSCLLSYADALAEATRRQTLRGVLRHRYELTVKLNDETQGIDLGSVISVAHSRYSLSAGVLMRVIGIAPSSKQRTLTLTTWS